MKAVISSDWHGDFTTAGVSRFDEIAVAARYSVQHAVDLSLNQKRGSVIYIFAGDLAETEGPGMLRTIELAVECAGELGAYAIPSFWLTGNHDVIEDGLGTSNLTPLKSSASGEVHDRPIVFEQGRERPISICFLPFTPHSHDYDPDAFVRAAAKEFPRVDLVVGHLMLEGIGPGSETRDMPRGRNVFWPLAAIKECWPDAVLVGGHYHEPQVYRGVHVVGSLARLTRTERGNRPCFLEVDL